MVGERAKGVENFITYARAFGVGLLIEHAYVACSWLCSSCQQYQREVLGTTWSRIVTAYHISVSGDVDRDHESRIYGLSYCRVCVLCLYFDMSPDLQEF